MLINKELIYELDINVKDFDLVIFKSDNYKDIYFNPHTNQAF